MTGRRFIGLVTGTLGLAALAMTVAGCQAKPAEWAELGQRNEQAPAQQAKQAKLGNPKGLHLVPQRNKFIIDLRARDVITIMRGVGFTNSQIIDLGEPLRDIMAQAGAVRIMIGTRTEAFLQASGGQVLISSASRGTFVYDPKRGQMALPNVMPGTPVPEPEGQY